MAIFKTLKQWAESIKQRDDQVLIVDVEGDYLDESGEIDVSRVGFNQSMVNVSDLPQFERELLISSRKIRHGR